MKILLTLTLCILLSTTAAAAPEVGPGVPDLTKGGELTRMNERWVGPVGIKCGFWRPRGGSTDEIAHTRQLLVLEVEKGSPADGVLEVDDVILGFDGTGAAKVPLSKGSELFALVPIANAINEAEARDPALLKLLVWRKGGTKTLTIKLEHLGRYSDTAPYNCPKSKRIVQKGIDALLKEDEGDKAGLSVLCLLAAAHPDDPRHDAIMSKAKEWAHALEDGGSPWYVGPKLMALSEYYMKSKDESIRPKLQALADYHALRVSWFGTCGHRYSEPQPDGSPNGRIAGYGPITCSGTLGFLGLSLAREAGVTSEAIEKSYKAQRAFFGHYGGRSGMGYGEMPYGISSGGDYNGKCSMSALALSMEEGQEEKVKFFTRTAALSSDEIRRYAHGGSYFGQVFHPLGANLGGEKVANLQFREVRYHMDLKRRWDGRYLYDASGNGYKEFEKAAVALIFYAAPLKQLVMTGRDRNPALEFTDEEFAGLLKVKHYDASKATLEQLFADLPTVQGFMRRHVGDELARRVRENPEAAESAEIIDKLIAMAGNADFGVYAQTGACFSLMQIKHKSRGALAALRSDEIAAAMVSLLDSEDAYIRFAAVRVLQRLDSSTLRPHADAIMDAILATARPTFPLDEEDPLQWAHGEMGSLLVKNALKDGLDGVDRSKLIPAIRSLLATPNGGARHATSFILGKLNKEETLAVSELLVHNIKIPAPANAMGGNASPNSQKALAKHFFGEALPLSLTHGPEDAIKSKIPQMYGKAALGMPSARQIMETAGEQMLVNAVDTQEVIDGLLNGEAPEEIATLKRIHSVTAADPVLKLPAAGTKLVVDATNFAVPGEGQTTYTWRKLYGAGKVSFTPNASSQSKNTIVTFTDKKPGKYCFEVEMTDALGLSVVRETMVVTLNESNGKLPRNRAPQAKSQALTAMPGFPQPVTFAGTDPDGDQLGYTVIKLPTHGVLSTAEGRLIGEMAAIDGPITYTADFGYEGVDQLSFLAIDGQGQSAKGTIEFKVSAAKVPVVVYEGFEYPMGTVHGKEGGSSFGFMGPWTNSRGASAKNYRVYRASLDEPGKSASISLPNLPSTEGRLTGGGHTTASRFLDTKLLAKHGLLEPGGELWFSAYVDGPGRFSFVEPEATFGFEVISKQRQVRNVLNRQITGESFQPWSRSANLRFPQGDPYLIVGQCIWGKTDEEPDTVRLFRVFNAPVFGPVLIDQPAAEMKEPIAQQKLNAIQLEIGDQQGFDEIRIGNSPASVMQGTVPMK